jgi:hypothetical protein
MQRQYVKVHSEGGRWVVSTLDGLTGAGQDMGLGGVAMSSSSWES